MGMNEKAADTYPDVQLAEKAVPVLGRALEAVAREEPVGGKGKPDICRLGNVERGQGQLERRVSLVMGQPCGCTDLVLSRLQADIVAELEHASKGIMENRHALFAQGKVEDHHAELCPRRSKKKFQVFAGGASRLLPGLSLNPSY